MVIQSVQIKNFRSIVNEKITLSNLNVFVGNNDAGKSNFIKALNLFFNDQTDFNTSFNFEVDYSIFAPYRKKMAKEISIVLEIVSPDSYKASKNILWAKTWRKEGLIKDERKFIDKSSIDEPRSRIRYWLDHIVFRYIPATKSDSYFQELLGDLHDTLTETIEENLISAATEFTKSLQLTTHEISSELTKRIQIESTLQLPTNLRDLFRTLDFETKMDQGKISLNYRGDGIKSRHIPIILKFISEQENMSRTQGAPRTTTIWGYEEPENNLELKKSFELAKDFYEYSKLIQMFITTHSPSFYGINHINEIFDIKSFDAQDIKIYFVSNNETLDKSSRPILIDENIQFIDDQLGLLPIITPYIREKIQNITQLNRNIERLIQEQILQNCATIFVEGNTDKRILTKAIHFFSSKLTALLESNELNISTDKNAGVNWVSDSVRAWVYGRKENKILALLDYDDAGKKCKNILLENDDKCKKYNQNGLLKVIQLHKQEVLIPIYRAGINLPISLEELYPPEIWKIARDKGFLVMRDNLNDLVNNVPFAESLKNHLSAKLDKDENLIMYCLYKVKMEHKEELVDYILKLGGNEQKSALSNFQPIIEKIEEYFCEN